MKKIPRGRKGGRKPFHDVPMQRKTIHLPVDDIEWLEKRGPVAEQVREAVREYRGRR